MATGNIDKFREVREILSEYDILVEMIEVKGLEVQGETNKEVAYISAVLLSKMLKKPILVEDSGLYIKALNGFPGPFSSYVYRTIGVNGVLKLMKNVRNREAYFISAVAYAPDPLDVRVFLGTVKGVISDAPRGGGWGFDPIFIPEHHEKTFGELGPKKNKISHRYKALKKFAEWLTG